MEGGIDTDLNSAHISGFSWSNRSVYTKCLTLSSIDDLPGAQTFPVPYWRMALGTGPFTPLPMTSQSLALPHGQSTLSMARLLTFSVNRAVAQHMDTREYFRSRNSWWSDVVKNSELRSSFEGWQCSVVVSSESITDQFAHSSQTMSIGCPQTHWLGKTYDIDMSRKWPRSLLSRLCQCLFHPCVVVVSRKAAA